MKSKQPKIGNEFGFFAHVCLRDITPDDKKLSNDGFLADKCGEKTRWHIIGQVGCSNY
jgi:hypothetical protein